MTQTELTQRILDNTIDYLKRAPSNTLEVSSLLSLIKADMTDVFFKKNEVEATVRYRIYSTLKYWTRKTDTYHPYIFLEELQSYLPIRLDELDHLCEKVSYILNQEFDLTVD